MQDAAKRMTHRPSKREVSVSDGEESTSDHPAVKNVKREEESLPIPEVIELQQKLHDMQLEGDFQRICREKEKQIMIELEKKLAEVSLQLEEAKGGAEDTITSELARENEALNKEMDEMRMEYHERVANLTTQLASERLQALDDQEKDRARIDELTQHLVQYEVERDKDRERFDELTQKLAQFERGQELLPQELQLPQLTAELQIADEETASAATVPSLDSGVEGHKIGVLTGARDPTNLFQLSRPNSSESTSLESARRELLSVVKKVDRNSLRTYVDRCFARDASLVKTLDCPACEKTFHENFIFEHFFSDEHKIKVEAWGSAVSRAALKYWVNMLQPKAAAQPMQQLAEVAATAASPREVHAALEYLLGCKLQPNPAAAQRKQRPAAAAAAPEVDGEPKEVIVLDD